MRALPAEGIRISKRSVTIDALPRVPVIAVLADEVRRSNARILIIRDPVVGLALALGAAGAGLRGHGPSPADLVWRNARQTIRRTSLEAEPRR